MKKLFLISALFFVLEYTTSTLSISQEVEIKGDVVKRGSATGILQCMVNGRGGYPTSLGSRRIGSESGEATYDLNHLCREFGPNSHPEELLLQFYTDANVDIPLSKVQSVKITGLHQVALN